MVPGTGIVLGHGMCRFEPRPGWVNSVAPGKRPLHNMAPVIALREGRAVLAVGASGGRTIVNNSASILIGRLVLGLDADPRPWPHPGSSARRSSRPSSRPPPGPSASPPSVPGATP